MSLFTQIKDHLKTYDTIYKFLYPLKLKWEQKLYQFSSKIVPDDAFLKWQYKRYTKKTLSLENPKTFHEKLQWLKIHWRKDILTLCSDKFRVRDYVAEKCGQELLNELLAVYHRVEDIKLDELPESFVLKVNHGTGQNIICNNKNDVDWDYAIRMLTIYLQGNPFYEGRSWGYKNIEPLIVCEKYLEEDGKPPRDYKFFCFDGEPKLLQLDLDRFSGHKRNLYDLEWNLLDVEYLYPRAEEEINKPKLLYDMIEYAKLLSKGFPFVRVDMYCVNERVYFGEMTFYPENGVGRFKPETFDDLLGGFLNLPLIS